MVVKMDKLKGEILVTQCSNCNYLKICTAFVPTCIKCINFSTSTKSAPCNKCRGVGKDIKCKFKEVL